MTTVRVSVPFESLVESVLSLNPREKLRLWRLLNEQIAQWEEDLLEEDPVVWAEIQEARDAYLQGDYITVEEYMARMQER